MTETLTENPPAIVPSGDDTPDAKYYERAKISIPGDQVHRATANLPDDQCAAIRWLYFHAIDNNMSREDIGRAIKYSYTSVSRIFKGEREGSLEKVVEAINKFKAKVESTIKPSGIGFIETGLSKRIFQLCEAARDYRRVLLIYSDSQIGKTITLEEVKKRWPVGKVVLVRMPTGGNLMEFLYEMAEALRISFASSIRTIDLKKRIIAAFDPSMLLIVDEVHQCFLRRHGKSLRYLMPLEFIREIIDRAGCGGVLCGTTLLKDELETGMGSGVLRQLARRRIAKLNLPDRPTTKELGGFAAAFGLPPATGAAEKVQDAVIEEEALGVWITLLRMGARIAEKEDSAMEWRHVLKAYESRKILEGK